MIWQVNVKHYTKGKEVNSHVDGVIMGIATALLLLTIVNNTEFYGQKMVFIRDVRIEVCYLVAMIGLSFIRKWNAINGSGMWVTGYMRVENGMVLLLYNFKGESHAYMFARNSGLRIEQTRNENVIVLQGFPSFYKVGNKIVFPTRSSNFLSDIEIRFKGNKDEVCEEIKKQMRPTGI